MDIIYGVIQLSLKGILWSLMASLLSFGVYGQSQGDVYNQWLKQRFADQHEKLIPIVAVADMYFGCDLKSNQEPNYQIKSLIMDMDRDELATKLKSCLAENTIHSEVAINYGLIGCFNEQLNKLPKNEKQDKMKLVRSAISSLSFEEKKKSFTKCVTSQAVSYLR